MSVIRSLFGLAALVATLAGAPAAVAQSSPSAFTTAARYDAARRIVGTIAPDPDGTGPLHYAAIRNTYDTAGNLTLVERGELSDWQSEATAPVSWPVWNGTTGFRLFNKVATAYDMLGRKTLESSWGSNDGGATWVESSVTQYSYDAAGRPECTTQRMNSATWGTLPASACTLGTSGSFGADRITHTIYDDADQVLKVQKGYGTPRQQDYVTYTYTPDGKQRAVIDANGAVALYDYDGFDRLVAWTFPSKSAVGSPATCTIGTIAEATDGFGNTVAGPTETRTAGDDCEKYSYDRNGNRAKLMKRDGNVIRYAFDALNRNTVKDIPGGTASDVYYAYDLRGLQTSARFVSTSGVGITNAYDGFGRLTSTTNNMGTTARTLSYTYDADGNRAQLTYPDASYFTYVYDGLDRLTTIKEAGTTAIVSSVFDAQGRLANQTRGAVTTTLGYDAVSRPTSWTDDLAGTASDVTSTFAYNPASQIATKTRSNDAYAFSGYVSVSRPYAVNGLNQYTTGGSATFSYDDNGNLTGDGSNSYTYDVENRMKTATIGGIANTLNYDPLGRLWQVVTPTKTLEWTYDGDSLVFEMNGPNQLRYVHGPNDDDPMVQYSGAGYGTRYSLHPDYQGSIVSTADATGAATHVNSYDEYGIGPTANIGRFQYTGQAWIAQLGLYYYKARMYSPTLGRFMQTDPIGYKDQIDLYAYVSNDPVNHTDSTGMEDDDWGTWTKNLVSGVPQDIARVPGDLADLGRAIVHGDFEYAFGGLPPDLGGGLAGVEASSARTVASEASASARAAEVHSVLDPIAQSKRTTAVLDTSGGRIIAGGGRDLTPAQRAALKSGETGARAPGAHAEVTALRRATASGATPRSLAATRPICPTCAAEIRNNGGRLTSPTTATFQNSKPWWHFW